MLPFKVSPIGIPSALTWNDFAFITNFVDEIPINLFVEIGAYMGGLAAVMAYRTLYRPDFTYLGIEILDNKPHPVFKKELQRLTRADLIIGDCFDQEVKDRVKGFVSRAGCATILCDGQHKPREIIEYHEMLKPGDFLIVHDFSEEKMSKENPARIDVAPILSKPNFVEATPIEWQGMTSMFAIKKV
ncbi:hypothetical protein LCGC14_2501000 [marine sediment metagenome]|uniref:Rhamnosyl O-methyltransferase n=1 Tax=marine sediment metagenome TaxID=412755 RepID=A0A0F9DVM6_9ZZZZ